MGAHAPIGGIGGPQRPITAHRRSHIGYDSNAYADPLRTCGAMGGHPCEGLGICEWLDGPDLVQSLPSVSDLRT
jgi:hypothetical protein